jgi:hypothetical protein
MTEGNLVNLRLCRSNIVMAVVAVSGCLIMNSCDSSKKPSKAPTPTPSREANPCLQTNSTTSNQTFTGSSTSTSASTSNPFLLNSEVTFEKDIKPILNSTTCSTSGCHSATSTTKFATYDSLVADSNLKTSIAGVADGSISHAALNLDAPKLALFASWASGGYQRGTALNSGSTSTSPSTTGANSTSSPTTVDPCNSGVLSSGGSGVINSTTSSTTTSATVDDFSDLLNPPKKKECNDAGQVFSRKDGGSCLVGSKLEPEWCNAAQIEAKFEQLARAGAAVKAKIAQYTGEGFTIEECGIENSKPVVTFVKLDKAAEQISYQIIRAQ